MAKLCLGVLIVLRGMQAIVGQDYEWHEGEPIDEYYFDSPRSYLDPINPFRAFIAPISRDIQYPISPTDRNCGRENYSSRVVRGSEASPNQFPWLAVIIIDGRGLCTGSLIHPNWVMTAAHCLTGSSYTVQLGAHDRRRREPNKVQIVSRRAFPHPNYRSLRNDIGLIRLPSPARLNHAVGLACLPSRSDASDDFAGRQATITGWGRTGDRGEISGSKLMYARNRPIISNAKCGEFYGRMPAGQMCVDTQARGGNRGICFGDSGGPLNLQQGPGEQYIQVGINSFVSGRGCASNFPNGFARVTEYLDFIERASGGEIQIDN